VLQAFPKRDDEERKDHIDGANHLVSRLDLFLDRFVDPVDSAARLCSRFPRLRCLIVSMDWELEDEADGPELFLSTLPACLQHLLLVRNQEPRLGWQPSQCPFPSIATFLHEHQELETLSLPFEFGCAPIELTQSGHPIGRSIRTVVLQHSSQARAMARLAEGTFPRLISLNVLCMEKEDEEDDHKSLLDFLSIHGQNLTIFGYGWYTRGGFAWNRQILLWLVGGSSKVTEAHVWFDRSDEYWWYGGVPRLRPELVHTLGVHIPIPAQTDPDGCEIMVAMHSFVAWRWTSAFINLKTIRIMHHVDVERYRLHNSVTQRTFDGRGRVARNPIRVEDISGRLLAQFSAGICDLDGVEPKLQHHCHLSKSPHFGRC
jgi:hypothetical protein